ncbi:MULTISPECIES: cysteine--tRNA ligase [Halomonadaceae]|jgi:cysteinyl-tRNA synthetase|uniref:Cysteine--tRNA ligase n=1 Tax=Vreelandella aquamarina TaxID=77097 RepID=A0A6F8SUQ7_9GAMM|nr:MULTISPECIES: cysteine--tRNA ligase [Halomonas]MAD21028.1 cysteine--tRNA ligase [Halomonas sp.]MCC4286656.1 cysteine--tRNA ligase [Halomonas meridiana]MCD1649792.1 cysteine--tRNA ligase [Halomonas axialensis]MCD2088097.1 cysteine--tRNA ligase [Halomonas meridiana]MCF2911815.1 cysteine--tRNA ligase [Halomonas sp. Cn5-12]|tara:strand:- start:2342 stop:3727 length:1386 start_codon:yes stop_codon:yes gene_type:complete
MHIYNTLTRRKEPFKPLVDGKVSMYVCGMTVYDYCHLGHARVMVAFDVITRYLRHRGYDVTYVRNITDIDDKILKRAEENGEPIDALTERMIAAMHEDEARLNVLPPSQEPRATRHIDDIIAMIETLIDKGFAYAAANGDVYYRVRKFTDYGKLNNRQLDDMRSGARVDVDVHKEDPLDFVLWKAAKPGEAHWHSPWGDGRPGWHIECSAMSTCCLGDTFDIHGGGPDLTFPHHENEIAQSEAATGKTYVNTWMHAGAVRVNQEKMSKSLGNFFTIRDVLAEHDPEVVRYLLVASHYRSAINYSADSLVEARKSLTRLYTALDGVNADEQAAASDAAERFTAAMDDDFNTPIALAALFDLARDLNRAKSAQPAEAPRLAGELKRLAGVLGLLQQTPQTFLKGAQQQVALSEEEIEAKIAERQAAKGSKDFARADAIRDELAALGIILKDSREGTTWVIEAP